MQRRRVRADLCFTAPGRDHHAKTDGNAPDGAEPASRRAAIHAGPRRRRHSHCRWADNGTAKQRTCAGTATGRPCKRAAGGTPAAPLGSPRSSPRRHSRLNLRASADLALRRTCLFPGLLTRLQCTRRARSRTLRSLHRAKDRGHLLFESSEGAVFHASARMQNHVHRRTQQRDAGANRRAHATLDAIANHGFAQRLGNRQTDTRSIRRKASHTLVCGGLLRGGLLRGSLLRGSLLRGCLLLRGLLRSGFGRRVPMRRVLSERRSLRKEVR